MDSEPGRPDSGLRACTFGNLPEEEMDILNYCKWAVFDVFQQKPLHAFNVEADAVGLAEKLNKQENQARRYKKFVVIPLSDDSLKV